MSDDHAKHDSGHHGGAHGGHGGGHEEEEEGGAPEWLISFADMVMLLMGFFVILFALNVQPKGGNPGGGGEESEGVAHEPLEIDPEFIESVRQALYASKICSYAQGFFEMQAPAEKYGWALTGIEQVP